MHSKRHTSNKFTQTHEQHKMNGETEIARHSKGSKSTMASTAKGSKTTTTTTATAAKRTAERSSGQAAGVLKRLNSCKWKGGGPRKHLTPSLTPPPSLPPSPASRPESLRVSTCPPACSDRGGRGGCGGEAGLEKGSQGTHRSACLWSLHYRVWHSARAHLISLQTHTHLHKCTHKQT